MDWWALWGFVIVALTLGATVAFGYLTFSKQFPKRSLTFAVSSSPLLNARTEGLEVVQNGVVLKEPYLVNLDVMSRSRADITSAAFDAGEPLVFEFGRTLYGSPAPDSSIRHELNGSQIRFQPQLIGRRGVVQLLFVTEGKPGSVNVSSPLIDVEVTAAAPAPRTIPMPYKLVRSMLAMSYVGMITVIAVAVYLTYLQLST